MRSNPKRLYYESKSRLRCRRSVLPPEWTAWFKNINDQSIEGIKHKSKPMRSVQFHPEASGGPRDTAWIFEQIIAEVKK